LVLFALTSLQVNYLDISIESKAQGSDDDAGSMYEGHTSDSYSSGGEDDNDDFVVEGVCQCSDTRYDCTCMYCYRGSQG